MTAQLQVGDRAPDFSLPVDGSQSISLAAFKGSKAVLFFYPKDDTDGCTAEALAFNRLRAEFGQAQTRILGISPDSVASHEKFKRKHGLALALGADSTRTMLEAYGVWREKLMYGRRYMGVERTTMLIDPQGGIARIWRKVKVPGHADEVLAAARAL